MFFSAGGGRRRRRGNSSGIGRGPRQDRGVHVRVVTRDRARSNFAVAIVIFSPPSPPRLPSFYVILRHPDKKKEGSDSLSDRSSAHTNRSKFPDSVTATRVDERRYSPRAFRPLGVMTSGESWLQLVRCSREAENWSRDSPKHDR